MSHRVPPAVAKGRTRAAQAGGGLLSPEFDGVLRDFNQFRDDDTRAAFADKWIRLTSARMDKAWTIFYQLLNFIKEKKLYEDPVFMEDRQERSTFREYWEQVVQKPFSTWLELEDTYHFVREHAPQLLKGTYPEAKEFTRVRAAVVTAALATTPEMAPTKQGERTDIGKLPKSNQSARASTNNIGERTQRKIDRLARDFPEHHDRVRRGELSVNAAALAAGIVQPTTTIPLEPEAAVRAITNRFKGDQLEALMRGLVSWCGLEVVESSWGNLPQERTL